MEFRKANANETDTVLQLYRSVVGMPHCAWDDEYPGRQEVDEDFRAGGLYVLEEAGQILGALSVVPVNELDCLPFWRSKDAREIARVVTAPNARGRGLAKYMVSEMISILRRDGCPAVHLLAAWDNPPALKTYRACGFLQCGACDMFGHHYLAFELTLS